MKPENQDITKECRVCRKLLPLSDFGKNSKYEDRLQRECRRCLSIQTRKAYWKNPEVYRAKARRQSKARTPRDRKRIALKYYYGLDIRVYDMMYDAQRGLCAICVDPINATDHDHATGEVRGLLCQKCNFGVGAFKDDPQLLMRAAAYLDDPAIPLRETNFALVERPSAATTSRTDK